MSTKDPKEKCSFNCWMIGGGVGVLGFLLMWLAGGYGVLGSVFWGLVLGALIGWLLNYLLCGKASAAGAAGAAGAAAMASRYDSGTGSYGAAQSGATAAADPRDDSGAGSFAAYQAEAAATATQEAMREDSGADSFDADADTSEPAVDAAREDSGAGSFDDGDDAQAATDESRDDSVARFGSDQSDTPPKASEPVETDVEHARDDSGAGSFGADQAEAAATATQDAMREDSGADSFDADADTPELAVDAAREDSGAGSFAGAAAATVAAKSTASTDTTSAAKNVGGSAQKPATDSSAAETTKSTTSKAKTAPKATKSADLGEDYDGDGILEGVNEGTRPEALTGPRDGGADNLKEIKGVGPKLEGLLHELGFYHFDQVANWTADEVAWVDANLKGFRGRVSRDSWVEQAKILASGAETEFSKKVQKGNVY